MTPEEVLRKYWGYNEFRPLQLDIIQSVLDRHDTLGLLPTGGGKSITFQVPAMMLQGLTIVVTPLISLMKDQVDNLLQRNIRAYALHSGLTRAESRLAMDRCRLGKAKMLYVSPERLQSQSFIDEVRTWDVSLIVVDEAHCISQWGYDFRPSYLKIVTLRSLFPEANILALTASATPEVTADIVKQLQFRAGYRMFAKSFDRDNLSYIVRYDEYKERTLLNALLSTTGCAIVYVRSRRRTRELAMLLQQSGITAAYYHAGLDPDEKEEKQNLWKSDTVRVMVATNAFGMGIDKPDVRMVIHFDLPSSLEEYYQEAGRAGRDGQPSIALTIVAKTDKALLARRISDSFPPRDFIVKVYELLGNFLDVAVGSGYNQLYEFNYDRFCTTYQLPPWLVYSALKILTKSEYIEFVDEVQSRARAMILVNKHEFYAIRLDAVTDAVFLALQREYTGLFADYVYIDEQRLASRAEVSANDVYESMLKLSRMRIVSYVPKKSTPYVLYTTSRELPKHLVLPKEAYEDRKLRMEQRVDAVRRFAFDTQRCRTTTILSYFGEKDVKPCGKCDVCRARRGASPIDRGSIIKAVKAMAGKSAQEIVAAFPANQRSEVIDVLRTMSDD